ncbi:MAG: flagella assembly protein FlgT [Oleispira sp.]|nr:flagella assembly protein FlgT [Oleispira sp.]MBL4882614.1 flagella assembly protein FlgT [Oleispira sp.]
MKILFILLVSWISVADAFVVEVQGEAPIIGSVNYARQQALEDAMRQASLRAEAHVVSTQLMTKGVMQQDDIQLKSQANVKNVEVLWEGAEEGIYSVTIRADVKPIQMCQRGNSLRKAVAVTGFGLVSPKQSSLGQLQNIEQDLARVFINTLNDSGQIHALDASHIGLYENPAFAPSVQNQQRHLTTSIALAQNLGAQYIVSGIVRGLDTLSTVANNVEPEESWLSLVGFTDEPTDRQFAVDVFVHDGFSGALIFSNSYATQGKWNLDRLANVRFASPAFWKSDYGHAVKDLLVGAIDDVSMSLRCQPFMAKIIKTEGKRLHIEALAGAGIRPGDTFSIYRSGTFYNLDLEPRIELTSTDMKATVKQVQPQFIVAELTMSAQQLSIQRNDIVIAW